MLYIELLKLYKEEKFEEVIKNGSTLTDYNSIFLVVRSYVALKMYPQALALYMINKNQLEKANLIEAAKLYFYLLIKERAPIVKINEEIERFKDTQYVNQETEEFLKNLDTYVFDVLLKNEEYNNRISVDELVKKLSSDDIGELTSALNEIHNNKDEYDYDFNKKIDDIIRKKPNFNMAYAILLEYLIFEKYDATFMVEKSGIYYSVNPKSLLPKRLEEEYLIRNILSKVIVDEKNLTLRTYVNKLVLMGIAYLLPETIENRKQLIAFFKATYQVLIEIFQIENIDETLYTMFLDADEELVKKYRNVLTNSLN